MAAQLNSSLMTVSVIALIIPAAFVSNLRLFYVTDPSLTFRLARMVGRENRQRS